MRVLKIIIIPESKKQCNCGANPANEVTVRRPARKMRRVKTMDKKLLTGAIASAVAVTVSSPVDAKKNAREGLDNVLDEAYCWYNEVEGYNAGWTDPNTAEVEGDTKYGGDIEFDAMLYASCDFYETEADSTEAAEEASFSHSESAIVDVDLSKSESQPFFYTCENNVETGADNCMAQVSANDVQAAAESAAEERYGHLAEECTADIEVCLAYEQACEDMLVCDEGDELIEGECWPNEGEPYEAVFQEVCVDTQECVVSEEVTVAGNFLVYSEYDGESGNFGVKEMNPGKGRGKQNYEKAYATCEYQEVAE